MGGSLGVVQGFGSLGQVVGLVVAGPLYDLGGSQYPFGFGVAITLAMLLLIPYLARPGTPVEGLSGLGSANGNAAHLHGRLADAGGNTLPCLATGADTAVELHVIADHADFCHRVGPLPIGVAPFTGAPILRSRRDRLPTRRRRTCRT